MLINYINAQVCLLLFFYICIQYSVQLHFILIFGKKKGELNSKGRAKYT